MKPRPETHEELKQRAYRAICTRIAQLVLPDEGSVDSRDALVLHNHGVIFLPDVADEPEADIERIEEANGPSLGPMILYRNRQGERSAARARDMILDRRLEVRHIATDHLVRLASTGGKLSRYTQEAISRLVTTIRTEDSWLRSAVDLADTLDDDWQLDCAGFIQSVMLGMDDGWQEYMKSILRPTISSLHKCSPEFVCAGLPVEKLIVLRNRLLNDSMSTDALCNAYLEMFGHVPLGTQYSLSGLLSERDASQGGPFIAEELLAWADRGGTPLARYHTCEALLAMPSRLAAEHQDQISAWFWEAVIPAAELEEPSESHAAWDLTHRLARYFVHYLEVRTPSNAGEPISGMAWWLASRIVAILSATDLSLISFGRQMEETLASTARNVWELACPPMQPTQFRWMTMHGPSPFALSLLSTVSSKSEMDWLMGGAGPGSTKQRVEALARIAVQIANLPLEQSDYRYSADARRILCRAFDSEPDDSTRAQLVAYSQGFDWSMSNSLQQALEALREGDAAAQQLIAHAIRQRVAHGDLSADDLWDVVSGPEWRTEIWRTLDAVAVQAIGIALVDEAARVFPEWAPQLPHLFASLAESREDAEDDRVAMFGLVLKCCCSLNAPSALVRLLRGSNAGRFKPLATNVKGNIESLLPFAGGWAAGRLRGLAVDLL